MLGAYDVDIEHQPGRQHMIADHALIADIVSENSKGMEDMISQLSVDFRMVLVFSARALTVLETVMVSTVRGLGSSRKSRLQALTDTYLRGAQL